MRREDQQIMRWVGFVALVIGISVFDYRGATAADDQSGNTWLALCAGQDQIGQALCLGYVEGISDGTVLSGKRIYCLPPNVTYGQGQAVAIKYMRNHPERLHLPFAILLLEAMEKAFPCK